MKKLKKDKTYQKQLEEEINNLKLELESEIVGYKEQKELVNKERTINKEVQAKFKELQSKYDFLLVQSYINPEKLQEADETIEQLRKSIQEKSSNKETLVNSEEADKQSNPINSEKSENNRLYEKLEQVKKDLESEKEKRKELEEKIEKNKEKMIQERANFEKKDNERKLQVTDLLARLQADYPTQAELDDARKIVRDAEELKEKSQEEAEKIIAEAEKEIREMKHNASQEIESLNVKIQHYDEIMAQIIGEVDSSFT